MAIICGNWDGDKKWRAKSGPIQGETGKTENISHVRTGEASGLGRRMSASGRKQTPNPRLTVLRLALAPKLCPSADQFPARGFSYESVAEVRAIGFTAL